MTEYESFRASLKQTAKFGKQEKYSGVKFAESWHFDNEQQLAACVRGKRNIVEVFRCSDSGQQQKLTKLKLPCFDSACHVGQLGEFVASVANGAQVATAAVPGASANRLVSILQDTLIPSLSTAVPGAMAAFSVPAVKAAIEAGVTAPKCVELELIMRVSQSGSEEEPASCAVVNYIGNPQGLSVETALPTVASLRALEPPPAESTEADEVLTQLADEVAACAADADVAASIQSDLPVELIESVEVRPCIVCLPLTTRCLLSRLCSS